MMSKEEAKAFLLLEANRKEDNEKNHAEHCITDEETVCTIDEEDIEDNGSACTEDNNMLPYLS